MAFLRFKESHEDDERGGAIPQNPAPRRSSNFAFQRRFRVLNFSSGSIESRCDVLPNIFNKVHFE